MSEETDTPDTTKPSERRTQERRQQKQGGRARRAELLLDKQAKERARQAVLEDQQAQLVKHVAELQTRLDAHERRLQQLEKTQPNPR